jgi:hypothetical protein
MRLNSVWLVVLTVMLASFPVSGRAAESAEDAERQKALADPYANDLGPDKLEGFGWVSLKDYPAESQAGYRLLLDKCAKCHTAARPLNSQFVEPVGAKEEKAAKVAALLAQPGVAAAPLVWQVEDGLWQRYVRRMMAKPGCAISTEEGKKIWAFLSFDSVQRKTGANAAAWKAHRSRLLEDFKAAHPDRYKTLYVKP